MRCNKCDSMDQADDVMLCGIYGVQLCVDCRNQWTLYIRGHDLYSKMEYVKAQEQAAEIAYTGVDKYEELFEILCDLAKQNTELENQLFATAADWCAM